MILATLCELARREGLLTNPDYEPKPVAWIISVSDGGKFCERQCRPPVKTRAGNRRRAKVSRDSATKERTSVTTPTSWWTSQSMSLGVEPDGKRPRKKAAETSRIVQGIGAPCLRDNDAPALAAVEAFLGSEAERALRRGEDRGGRIQVERSLRVRISGQLVHELPGRSGVLLALAQRVAQGTGSSQCLICGSRRQLPLTSTQSVKIPGRNDEWHAPS